MMYNNFEAEGIWGHIVSRAKPVEISEIASIIGTKLLRDNSALWEELKAFNSILSDLATSDLLERVDDIIYHGGVSSGKDNGKDKSSSGAGGWGQLTAAALHGQGPGEAGGPRGVPSLDFTVSVVGHGHISNNNVHNTGTGTGHNSNSSTGRRGGGGSQQSARSATSMDSLEFVQSIEANISVLSIHTVVEQIRKALIAEHAELESEIGVLRHAMDGGMCTHARTCGCVCVCVREIYGICVLTLPRRDRPHRFPLYQRPLDH